MHSPFTPLFSPQRASAHNALALYDAHADVATQSDFEILISLTSQGESGLQLLLKMLASETFLINNNSKKQSPLLELLPLISPLLSSSREALSASYELAKVSHQNLDFLQVPMSQLLQRPWDANEIQENHNFYMKIATKDDCVRWISEFNKVSQSVPNELQADILCEIMTKFTEIQPEKEAIVLILQSQNGITNDDQICIIDKIYQSIKAFKKQISAMEIQEIIQIIKFNITQFTNLQFPQVAQKQLQICQFLMQLLFSNNFDQILEYSEELAEMSIELLRSSLKFPLQLAEVLYISFIGLGLYSDDQLKIFAMLLQNFVIKSGQYIVDSLKEINYVDLDFRAMILFQQSSSLFNEFKQIFINKNSIFNLNIQNQYMRDEFIRKQQILLRLTLSQQFWQLYFTFLSQDQIKSLNQIFTVSKFTETMQTTRLNIRITPSLDIFQSNCWISLLEAKESGISYYFEMQLSSTLVLTAFKISEKPIFSAIFAIFSKHLLNDNVSDYIKMIIQGSFLYKDHISYDVSSLVYILLNSLFIEEFTSATSEIGSDIAYLLFLLQFIKKCDNAPIFAICQLEMKIALFCQSLSLSQAFTSGFQSKEQEILLSFSEDAEALVSISNIENVVRRKDFLLEDEHLSTKIHQLDLELISRLIQQQQYPEQFCNLLDQIVGSLPLFPYSLESLLVAIVTLPFSVRSKQLEIFDIITPLCLLSNNLALRAFILTILTQENQIYDRFKNRKLNNLSNTILQYLINQGAVYMEDLTAASMKQKFDTQYKNQSPSAGQFQSTPQVDKVETFDSTWSVQVLRGRLQQFVVPSTEINNLEPINLLNLLQKAPISSNYQFLAQETPSTSAECFSACFFRHTPFQQISIYLQHQHILSPHSHAEMAMFLIKDKFEEPFAELKENDCENDIQLNFYDPISGPSNSPMIYDSTQKSLLQLNISSSAIIQHFAIWIARQPFLHSEIAPKTLDEERQQILPDIEDACQLFIQGKNQKSVEFYYFVYLLLNIKIQNLKTAEFNIMDQPDEFLGKFVQNLTKIAFFVQLHPQLPITISLMETANFYLIKLIKKSIVNNKSAIYMTFLQEMMQILNLQSLNITNSLFAMRSMLKVLDGLNSQDIEFLAQNFENFEKNFISVVFIIINNIDIIKTPKTMQIVYIGSQLLNSYLQNKQKNSLNLIQIFDRQLVQMKTIPLMMLLELLQYDNSSSSSILSQFYSLKLEVQTIILSWLIYTNIVPSTTKMILESQQIEHLYVYLRQTASGRVFNDLVNFQKGQANNFFISGFNICVFTQQRAVYLSCQLLQMQNNDLLQEGLAQMIFSYTDQNFYKYLAKQLFNKEIAQGYPTYCGENIMQVVSFSLSQQRYHLQKECMQIVNDFKINISKEAVLKMYQLYYDKYYKVQITPYALYAINTANLIVDTKFKYTLPPIDKFDISSNEFLSTTDARQNQINYLYSDFNFMTNKDLSVSLEAELLFRGYLSNISQEIEKITIEVPIESYTNIKPSQLNLSQLIQLLSTFDKLTPDQILILEDILSQFQFLLLKYISNKFLPDFIIVKFLIRLQQIFQANKISSPKLGRQLLEICTCIAFNFLNTFTDIVLSDQFQIADDSNDITYLKIGNQKLPKDSLLKLLPANQSQNSQIANILIELILSYSGKEQISLQQDFFILLLSIFVPSTGRPFYNTLSKLLNNINNQIPENCSIQIPINLNEVKIQYLKIDISTLYFIKKITLFANPISLQVFSKLAHIIKDYNVRIDSFIDHWTFQQKYALFQLCKLDDGRLETESYIYFKQYIKTSVSLNFVESAVKIYISLNKLYSMSLFLQDYYSQDINTAKQISPGSCLFLSYLNKSEYSNYSKYTYPHQQQQEQILKLVDSEIDHLYQNVNTFDFAVLLFQQFSNESLYIEIIALIKPVILMLFYAPKPLIELTKVINKSVQKYISTFYKLHDTMGSLIILHEKQLTTPPIIQKYASTDLSFLSKKISPLLSSLLTIPTSPQIKEGFSESLSQYIVEIDQLQQISHRFENIETRAFNNFQIEIEQKRVFYTIQHQLSFRQHTEICFSFKQQVYILQCCNQSALLAISLILLAKSLGGLLVQQIDHLTQKFFTAPLSNINLVKSDQRTCLEKSSVQLGNNTQKFIGICLINDHMNLFTEKSVQDLFYRSQNDYYKQQNIQVQPESPNVFVIGEQMCVPYSYLQGVDSFYTIIDQMHCVHLPGIRSYPHQQSRFSFISLFCLQLLQISARNSKQNKLYKVLRRIFSTSSDFSFIVYKRFIGQIFSRSNIQVKERLAEQIVCTHDLAQHNFYMQNMQIASIQRQMVQLLLLLPLNSLLIRNNLAPTLIKVLNQNYTFPMDIHTLLLLSETYQQSPFHSELTKLSSILISFQHSGNKRDSLKKYSYLLSHHQPAISPLHQSNFLSTFDNSGYENLQFLEKLFAAGPPHFDPKPTKQNPKQTVAQKEKILNFIDQLQKIQQLFGQSNISIHQLEAAAQNLIIGKMLTQRVSQNDIFSTEAIQSGIMPALAYEIVSLGVMYLNTIFEAIINKIDQISARNSNTGLANCFDVYKQQDITLEQRRKAFQGQIDDFLKKIDDNEKATVDILHKKDEVSFKLQNLYANDPQNLQVIDQCRNQYSEFDTKQNEITKQLQQLQQQQIEAQSKRESTNTDKFAQMNIFVSKIMEFLDQQNSTQSQLIQLSKHYQKLVVDIEELFKFEQDQLTTVNAFISTEKIGQRIISQFYDDLGCQDVVFGMSYPIVYKFSPNNQYIAYSYFSNRKLFELNANFRIPPTSSKAKILPSFRKYHISCDSRSNCIDQDPHQGVYVRNRPNFVNFGLQADAMHFTVSQALSKGMPSADFYCQFFENCSGMWVDSLSRQNYMKQKEKAAVGQYKEVMIQLNEALKKQLRSQFKQIIGRITESTADNSRHGPIQIFLKHLKIYETELQPNKLDCYRTQLVLYEKDCFNVQLVLTQLNNLLEAQSYSDLDSLSSELREEYLKRNGAHEKSQHTFLSQTDTYQKLYDQLVLFSKDIRTPDMDFQTLVQQICSQKLEQPDSPLQQLASQPPVNANQIQINNLNQYFTCQTVALINSIIPGQIRELFNLHQSSSAVFSSVLNILASDFQNEKIYSSPQLDFETEFDSSLMRKVVEGYTIFSALYPDVAIETVLKQGILRRQVGETIVKARNVGVKNYQNVLNCGDIDIYQILIFFMIQRYTPSSIAPGPSVLFFEEGNGQTRQEIVKELENINYEDYKINYKQFVKYWLDTIRSVLRQDVDKYLTPELEYSYQCDAAMINYRPQTIIYLIIFALMHPIENKAIINRFLMFFRDLTLQAYGRFSNRNMHLLQRQYAILVETNKKLQLIHQLACENIQNESIDSHETILQIINSHFYTRDDESNLSQRDYSTIAYTRLLLLTGVLNMLSAPFNYLQQVVDDTDKNVLKQAVQAASALWKYIKLGVSQIRFSTITNLGQHAGTVMGDPISAVKLTQDQIVENWLDGKIHCCDEQGQTDLIPLQVITMLDRIRTDINNLILSGSLTVALKKIQKFEALVEKGLTVPNIQLFEEFQMFKSFIYEIFIDIGSVPYSHIPQDIIAQTLKKLSYKKTKTITTIAIQRHYYASLIASEEKIDLNIKNASLYDLFSPTYNMFNSLINMIQFNIFTPQNDFEKQLIMQKFYDSQSIGSTYAFQKLLNYILLPPTYLLLNIEEPKLINLLEEKKLQKQGSLINTMILHIKSNYSNIPPATIFQEYTRILNELCYNINPTSVQLKFLLFNLINRIFVERDIVEFDYKGNLISIIDQRYIDSTEVYLSIRTYIDMPEDFKVQQYIKIIFKSAECNFQDLELVRMLRNSDITVNTMKATSSANIKNGMNEIHKIFQEIVKSTDSLITQAQTDQINTIIMKHKDQKLSVLLNFYLLLTILSKNSHLQEPMNITNIFSGLVIGPIPWALSIVKSAIEKQQISSQQFSNLQSIIQETIGENFPKGSDNMQVLQLVEQQLTKQLKQFNQEELGSPKFLNVNLFKLTMPFNILQKSGTTVIRSTQVSAVQPQNSLFEPYFDENAYLENLHQEPPKQVKIDASNAKIVILDNIPFIQAVLQPTNQTILIFHFPESAPLRTLIADQIPYATPESVLNATNFWQNYSTSYKFLPISSSSFALIFDEISTFRQISHLQTTNFPSAKHLYHFKKSICGEISKYMLLNQQFSVFPGSLQNVVVDFYTGKFVILRLNLQPIFEPGVLQKAAISAYYTQDCVQNTQLQDSVLKKDENTVKLINQYAGQRRARIALSRELVAFLSPHFAIGVISVETAKFVKKMTVDFVKMNKYPYQCLTYDLCQISAGNMNHDLMSMVQNKLYLQLSEIGIRLGFQPCRDEIMKGADMSCRMILPVVQSIESFEMKRKIKTFNVDGLCANIVNSKIPIPGVVEWVVMSIAQGMEE